MTEFLKDMFRIPDKVQAAMDAAMPGNDRAGMEVPETIYRIKEEFPSVHGICSLSNISFGLPNRKSHPGIYGSDDDYRYR